METRDGFHPLARALRDCRAGSGGALTPAAVGISGGAERVYEFNLTGEAERDFVTAERIVKFLIWQAGGDRVTLYGLPEPLARRIQDAYSPAGARRFDCEFMSAVYGRPFTVEAAHYRNLPVIRKSPSAWRGENGGGRRIGLDAGGTSLKLCAVRDGEKVLVKTFGWSPKEWNDPSTHFEHIVRAFRYGVDALGGADAAGVSTAGVVVDNRLVRSSLFPLCDAGACEDVFIRAAQAVGVPQLRVSNDGDVAALAGSVILKKRNLLGVSLGTSIAGGYIDKNGYVTGMLNELEFTPVDISSAAPVHGWSGDRGVCGCYFDARACVEAGAAAGIAPGEAQTEAQAARQLSELAGAGDARAVSVFETTGEQLGHAAAVWYEFYGMDCVLLMGGRTSGAAGRVIAAAARRTLERFYPDLSLSLLLPPEELRTTGQAYAAALLP